MSTIWEKLDASEIAAKTEFTLIKEGLYRAQVTDVEVKEDFFVTEINVEFTIADGEFVGRKCWWSSKMKDDSSAKALAFVKGQICKLAGVESTNGNPLEVLTGCNGNQVLIEVKHTAGLKDPSKTYLNVYVREKL